MPATTTLAPRPRVIVTALGEVLADDELVYGSTNLTTLAAKLGRPVGDGDVEREADDLVAATLPADQAAFVRRVWGLQALDDGRFRVYGQLWDDGPLTLLVTEFVGFADDLAFWDRLERTALRAGGAVLLMTSTPYQDRRKYAGDVDWIEGPDHGRLENQVELVRAVDGLDLADVILVVDRIRAATEELWATHGVCVS